MTFVFLHVYMLLTCLHSSNFKMTATFNIKLIISFIEHKHLLIFFLLCILLFFFMLNIVILYCISFIVTELGGMSYFHRLMAHMAMGSRGEQFMTARFLNMQDSEEQ